jgi:hypothetical protein
MVIASLTTARDMSSAIGCATDVRNKSLCGFDNRQGLVTHLTAGSEQMITPVLTASRETGMGEVSLARIRTLDVNLTARPHLIGDSRAREAA